MNDHRAGLPAVALVIGRLARVPDSALLGGRNQAAQAVASSRSSSASMVEMHVCRKAVLSEMRECRGRIVRPAGGGNAARELSTLLNAE